MPFGGKPSDSFSSSVNDGSLVGGRRHLRGANNRQASRLGFSMGGRYRSGATARSVRLDNSNSTNNHNQLRPKAKAAYRRYRVGENVLVCCNYQRKTFVNQHGFPPGEGFTAEEQSGPYSYVFATVQTVHFDEFAEYYTVLRADTGQEERGDTEFMAPFLSAMGEEAALRAATQSNTLSQEEVDQRSLTMNSGNKNSSKLFACLKTCSMFLCMPVLLFLDCFLYVMGEYVCRCCNRCFVATKRQASLCLNGKSPWVCSVRITAVNIVVICSMWYMFSDQARLAFFYASADNTLAVINLVVWCILMAELLFEVFIRPDGYSELIISDKAYAPTTVRFINAFHLVVETVSLLCFIPEFFCLFSTNLACDDKLDFSFFNAALTGVVGPTNLEFLYGKAYFALIRFRVFGLVRHWKKMWINNTFINMRWKAAHGFLSGSSHKQQSSQKQRKNKKVMADSVAEEAKKKEAVLTNASNIGTALTVTNSYRVLIMFCAIIGIFPALVAFFADSTINKISYEMTEQLQATNIRANNSLNETCEYLGDSIRSWVIGLTPGESRRLFSARTYTFLLKLEVKPSYCSGVFGVEGGSGESVDVLSLSCDRMSNNANVTDYQESEHCRTWRATANATGRAEIANITKLRTGAIAVVPSENVTLPYTRFENGVMIVDNSTVFSVVATFNETYAVESAAFACFLSNLLLLLGVLGGLSVLRRDAEVLVLGPLRRMLKIVAGYAKNPLIQPKLHRQRRSAQMKSTPDHSEATISDSEDSFDGGDGFENDLGNYETEQLINAVSKITDLLRKCWGVAGADIISTNLATREGALTEVFNPTVPGKSVYALFGFAAINGFDHALKNLGGDVMVLINDVAKVLHDEVFRWGFGDSGQCNKNLGAAFLMVFRIGLVKEVIEKLDQATNVIFSTHTKQRAAVQQKQKAKARKVAPLTAGGGTKGGTSTKIAASKLKGKAVKRKADASKQAMSVSLQSLPGISTFTDRAVIGMLKSYASIHRDKKLLTWNDDFRLGAGVGAFTVSLIYGMDAGWAVEGAVGSEYKIDATYLSPHVNMASRMMSACKQYGVSILLSQAVQELMSDSARSKLRHLDTVTVKGSSVKQRIYTYDARSRGVDFFLFSRTDDQADLEADRYSPNVWNIDQDLRAMRQHLTDDFLEEFKTGRKAYLQGDWALAIERLERANEIMLEMAVEEGYLIDSSVDDMLHEEELSLNGDGPTQFLLNFMRSKGGIAPPGWDGWHPLTSK